MPHISPFIIMIIMLAAFPYKAVGQTITPPHLNSIDRDSVEVHSQVFDLNAARINPTPGLEAFAARVDSVVANGAVTHVDIEGAASPDGPDALNRRLALRRAQALSAYFQKHSHLPDSICTLRAIGEDWDGFRLALPRYLGPDDLTKVERIIDSEPDREKCEHRLRVLDRGRIWSMLADSVFPVLRRASMTVSLLTGERMEYTIDSTGTSTIVSEITESDAPFPKPHDFTETTVIPAKSAALPVEPNTVENRHWYLKTNIPAWAMLWTNIAVELDCAPHWSVQLPIYYSGFNYFTSRRKFRTVAVMPEARYWLHSANQGFFIGTHLGVAWYNVAFGGSTRYQDHSGHTPALGGGINAGYRMSICSSGRWRMEFSLGAGIYRLDYDTFENRHNGLLTGRRKRSFVGIDNAAVSIVYTFDLKGGSQ